MSREFKDLAKEQQDSHREMSGKEGIILDFLDKPIPFDWDQMSVASRKMFLAGGIQSEKELVQRDKTCALEVWVECFGGDAKYMKRSDSNDIVNILVNSKNWERIKTPRRFGPYGNQKGFRRVTT